MNEDEDLVALLLTWEKIDFNALYVYILIFFI